VQWSNGDCDKNLTKDKVLDLTIHYDGGNVEARLRKVEDACGSTHERYFIYYKKNINAKWDEWNFYPFSEGFEGEDEAIGVFKGYWWDVPDKKYDITAQ
jgi:hypothetical protein